MIKTIIVICIILLIINLILLIPIKIKIYKRKEDPFKIEIRILHFILNKANSNKKSKLSKIKYSDILFHYNLNEILKKQKEESFYIYLVLEYATINKVTYIPVVGSNDDILFPYLGFGGIMSINLLKRYIESTFKYVDNDYYQIIFDNQTEGIMLEIELKVTLFKTLIAIIKKYKLFIKTLRG